MPKAIKPTKTATSTKRFCTGQPWRTQHGMEHSVITAYSEAGGKWENVLMVSRTSGCSAEVMAEFIAGLVNETIHSEKLMLAAMKTMQVFLIETDFSEKVEKPMVDLIKRIKKTYGVT